MSVPAAYLGVILIWTTTPLAIKWSAEGPGFLFGVTGRMVVGAALALLALRVLGVGIPWHRRARHTYLAAGLGIYAAMLCVYWSSQYIPSGWISVIFGVSPIATGIMAYFWLGDRDIGVAKILGMLLGVSGLSVIFVSSSNMGSDTIYGVAGILCATLFHSASSVWVKRLNPGLHGMSIAAGGLLVAVPLFLFTWSMADAGWPDQLPGRALYAILYLALFGSVLGFALYYFVLKKVAATRVALITLVTPVTALMLGHWLNAEPLGWRLWLGTAMILLGLLSFEAGDRGYRILVARARRTG